MDDIGDDDIAFHVAFEESDVDDDDDDGDVIQLFDDAEIKIDSIHSKGRIILIHFCIFGRHLNDSIHSYDFSPIIERLQKLEEVVLLIFDCKSIWFRLIELGNLEHTTDSNESNPIQSNPIQSNSIQFNPIRKMSPSQTLLEKKTYPMGWNRTSSRQKGN